MLTITGHRTTTTAQQARVALIAAIDAVANAEVDLHIVTRMRSEAEIVAGKERVNEARAAMSEAISAYGLACSVVA